jgi:hypothetical protein
MNLKPNDYVKVTKLKACDSPHYPTAKKEDYKQGEVNFSVSPFEGYWVQGLLLDTPMVRQPLAVDRHLRNGESVRGYFCSSPVEKIEEEENRIICYTANSVYQIELVPEVKT